MKSDFAVCARTIPNLGMIPIRYCRTRDEVHDVLIDYTKHHDPRRKYTLVAGQRVNGKWKEIEAADDDNRLTAEDIAAIRAEEAAYAAGASQ